ncbi:hypothetical protein CEE37_05105 [candidate division LCP-89 bacterium B3_LCP]|uniref:Uncharacterized protein n=1 Tax=candidate division LCP-89 bacterium B3_LCP TaxID=2012998 RepID=A0A532V1G6_UNCL8|nr:MAG: hypothetical protein CEE37_05105 [candidate division LCP-89 bacterium B3_LCP]
MSWTDLSTVRKHLQETTTASTTIEDEEHILSGTDIVQLERKSITQHSEEVKTIDLGSPFEAGLKTLTGTNWMNLVHDDLVPDTIVITADQALDTVYIEGTDYITDYEVGRIKRAAGSAIPSGGQVYVWYFYFTVHTRDTDYEIDYDSGELNRIDIGSIANGSTVYVDYSVSAGTVADELIEQAIDEAEDKILARLKDEYSPSSTDQGLKTGATELTLAVVCNAKAMDVMLKSPSDEADGASGQWRMMSQRYENQAWETLDRFVNTRTRRRPVAKNNKSWDLWAD